MGMRQNFPYDISSIYGHGSSNDYIVYPEKEKPIPVLPEDRFLFSTWEETIIFSLLLCQGLPEPLSG